MREFNKINLWINLTKDMPISYIHAYCKVEGMGVPSIVKTIPHRQNRFGLTRSIYMYKSD